jgi:hypothetical protein
MNLDKLEPSIRKRIDFHKNGCWLWTGSLNKRGYGVFSGSRNVFTTSAHRIVYEYLVGDPGENLHHRETCEKKCVNPEHLTPMTISDHASHHGEKTHCVNGHEFTEKNTYIRPDTGGKQCRRCKADRQYRVYLRDPQADHDRVTEQRRTNAWAQRLLQAFEPDN